MFETILAAVDGSDHSDQAVHLAADIATKYQARLTLLHVCPEGSVPEGLRRLASVEFAMPSGPAAARPDLSEGVGHIMDPVREGSDAASAAEIYEKLGHQILEHSKGIALEKGVAAVETLLDKGDAARRHRAAGRPAEGQCHRDGHPRPGYAQRPAGRQRVAQGHTVGALHLRHGKIGRRPATNMRRK